ncbi:MAG: SlyX family protein [Luminiphilus sp.]|nr:SlyX family protein [Luminiphilus sp.]
MSDAQSDLESQISFLENTVLGLDKAMASQQQQILELQTQLRMLHGEIKTQGARLDEVDTTSLDAPPPHY